MSEDKLKLKIVETIINDIYEGDYTSYSADYLRGIIDSIFSAITITEETIKNND